VRRCRVSETKLRSDVKVCLRHTTSARSATVSRSDVKVLDTLALLRADVVCLRQRRHSCAPMSKFVSDATLSQTHYGVAMTSRLLTMTGLFCKTAL